jgi:hypothetical protein
MMITTMDSNTNSIIHVIHVKKHKTKPTDGAAFDAILLEAVDEIFESFGSACKETIYFHLKNTFNIKKQDIPHRIQEFSDVLKQLLGEGAKIIELRMIETLHRKAPNFVYNPSMGELVFADYVEGLRRFYLITNRRGNTRLSLQGKQGAFQLLHSKPYVIFA